MALVHVCVHRVQWPNTESPNVAYSTISTVHAARRPSAQLGELAWSNDAGVFGVEGPSTGQPKGAHVQPQAGLRP